MTVSDLEKRNASVELWRKWIEAFEAYDNAPADTSELALEELNQAEDAAHKAYEAAGQLIETADRKDIEHCHLTGVPLLVSDDVVMVLRSALPGKREEAA